MKHLREKNHKQLILTVLTGVIMLTLSPTAAGSAEELALSYSFERPEINKIMIDGVAYDRITVPSSPNFGRPGQPALPAFGARILIPYGAEVDRVEISSDGRISLGTGYLIEPVGHPIKLSANPGDLLPLEPDPSIYSADNPFPQLLFHSLGTQHFRGYQILIVRLHPVQFVPTTGELLYHSRLTVTVSLKTANVANSLYRGQPDDVTEVSAKVDNPELVSSYTAAPLRSGRNHDLLIITTTALASDFQPLADYHDTSGILTEIRTTDEIGSTDPDVIRDFIRDRYLNDGIRYVLIGADDDLIPAKDLYVRAYPGGDIEYNMPADFYFGCLDGTFNYDGDSYWGEPDDGEGGYDVDLIAEVFVGRAAVGNSDEAIRFVNKTLVYLNNSDPYLDNVLLVGEHLGFGGVSEYAGNSLDQLIDGSGADGYTTVGIPSSDYLIDQLYDRDWPNNSWPNSELAARINAGLHIINHFGHGSPGYAMKMTSGMMMSLLTNTDYCFVYSQTCLAGHLDSYDCFAEYMTIKSDYGAFAIIMNARYGWGMSNSTDGPSQRFNREFWDAVFNPAESRSRLAWANQQSKEDNLYRINESCMRWCYYELNLFGDPTIPIYGADTCIDTDSDLVCDPGDNCPAGYNPDQADTDGDQVGDLCDDCTDTDGDGFGNPGFPANTCPEDNCPEIANVHQVDTDNDGLGDGCDKCTDSDGDGFGDLGPYNNTCPDDNCAAAYNPDQADSDGDGIGDACDNCTDTDDDGFGDPGFPATTCQLDNCPDLPNPDQMNSDEDPLGDACDNCPEKENLDQADTNGDGIGDACCCETERGNFDGIIGPSGPVDVSDVSCIVDYLFQGSGYEPDCPPESNIDGQDGPAGPIDISDLTYLVDFLFKGGPPPPACP